MFKQKILNEFNLMDVSMNEIDLKYLTNYSYEVHIIKPKKNDVYEKDLAFYRRRIFKLTKDLLRGQKSDNSVLDACFKNYTEKSIDYFKFIDKSDIIQEDYKNVKKEKKEPMGNLDMVTTNEIMTKRINRSMDISHLLNIKSKRTSKSILMPKERTINLKHPSLKVKGLGKKKNINN